VNLKSGNRLRRTASIIALIFGAAPQFAQETVKRAETPPLGPVPTSLTSYSPVTTERLLHPQDGDWLMGRRTYDGWGYSPLSQITPDNVKRLDPVWVVSTGVNNGHEAVPMVNNGAMFVSTPGSQVMAIDVKTGIVLWRYKRKLPEDVIWPHPTSRGVALYNDKVYFAAGDAVLVALDARTGKEVWTTKVAENKQGYYMSLAPIVADGKVLMGTSGGDLGIRGFVAAFDAETGKEVWRAFTIPAPGEPGSETWPAGGEQWKSGGGSTWVAGNYDPETKLTFWGTSNGGPWMGDERTGDNLYTGSTIAIDITTGKIRGYHQYVPNEAFDWDEVSPPILVDYKRNGKTIKGLIDVARDGYIWFMERTEGPIHFIDGEPYVQQNVFTSLDPRTGRPEIDPTHKPVTGKSVDFCPSHWGGKNWPPISFSPKTRMIYIPANENLCDTFTARKMEHTPLHNFNGVTSVLWLREGADHIGEVQAWNVDTGKRVWTHTYPNSANYAGMLATGGGLVFIGGTNDRMFHAFDASTGKLLWEFPTNSGIIGPASSFMVDGKQYIAVESGWGMDPRSIQARLNTQFPGKFPEVVEGGAIWVFAVK
jgi:alcohol dehydrogenase (cytochrome c)